VTGRYVLVTDRYGDTWAAEVLEVLQTASSDAVQVTYRMPNGREHRRFFRPAAIKHDRREAQRLDDEPGYCCDIHYDPDPWAQGGKFIDSGLRRVEDDD
jgi:hypothetical protein